MKHQNFIWFLSYSFHFGATIRASNFSMFFTTVHAIVLQRTYLRLFRGQPDQVALALQILNIKRADKGVETGIIVESDNMDDNAETLVSTKTPDPNEAFFNKHNIELQGSFNTLQDRGLKITS